MVSVSLSRAVMMTPYAAQVRSDKICRANTSASWLHDCADVDRASYVVAALFRTRALLRRGQSLGRVAVENNIGSIGHAVASVLAAV